MDTPQEKTCTKCGLTKSLEDFPTDKRGKYGKASQCKDCKRAYKKTWTVTNADRIRVRNAAYQAEHRDEHAAWQKQYDETHKEEKKVRNRRSYEKLKAEGKLWSQRNAEQKRAMDRQYYAEHPEEMRAYRFENREKRAAQARTWEAANPDYNRERCHRRRTRQNGATIADLSPAQWEEILGAFNYRCAYCPGSCHACKNKTHDLQQEHIEPVIKGGNYTVHNIVPACGTCNQRKKAGPPLKPVQPLLLTLAPAKPHKPKKKGS